MFSQIFDVLDSDQDGFLSARRIQTDELPSQTNELLGEIYQELIGHVKIDREEFIEACNRLYRILQPAQRRSLLNTFKQDRSPARKEFTF